MNHVRARFIQKVDRYIGFAFEKKMSHNLNKSQRGKEIPSASTIATLCNSPPDSVFTSWSIIASKLIGFNTSVWNCGCMNACLICLSNSIRTVPGNLGEIVCGFKDTANDCLSVSSSGVSPANRRTKVVLPVPFSPSMTMISESVKLPASTVSLKLPSVLVMEG